MDPAVERRSLLLPEGTRLVHIGPPKTGTTSLQASFHASRDGLLAQGVRYAGRKRHSRTEAYAALRRPEHSHLTEPPPIGLWQSIVDEIRDAREPRVVLSSEIFTDGDLDLTRRLIDDLDPARIHVAVTLRPLPRILASQWQQGVRGGLQASFDDWLRQVFSGEGSVAKRFWHRHRHDRLIARWAGVAGLENVTVVVVDERDHGMILGAFEQLLGLREGTLRVVHDRTNRSMTLPEVEAVRAFNVAFSNAGLSHALLHRVSPWAIHMRTRAPDPAEPRIEAPQWALDRAADIAQEMVDAIASCGVRVVGDLASLTARYSSPLASDQPPEVSVPQPVAAALSVAMLVGAGLAPAGAGTQDPDGRSSQRRAVRDVARQLSDVDSRVLAAAIAGRVWKDAARQVRNGARLVGRPSRDGDAGAAGTTAKGQAAGRGG